jgi:D-alanine-D-alanine ligase
MKIAILYNINRNSTLEEIDFDRQSTMDALAAALLTKHEVLMLECERDVLDWLQKLLNYNPDLVFNFAAGFPSVARECFYPALYEQLTIPYFGSDPTTMLIAHNKALTNIIVERVGVKIPWSYSVYSEQALEHLKSMPIKYPLFVKPNSEAWGIGVGKNSIVHNFDELQIQANRIVRDLNNIALIQQYIPLGIEVSMSYVEGLGTTGVFGPVMYDFDKEKEVFSYEVKSFPYKESILKYPNTLSEEVINKLHFEMAKAVKALDIRGYARADFRIDNDNNCYFIEINARTEVMPVCSDFMQPILQGGYTYEEVVLHMVEYAYNAYFKRKPSMAGLFEADFISKQTAKKQ